MKFDLTEWDIDIISDALKNRIDYLEGMIMLQESFGNKSSKKTALLKIMLRETKHVQRITTYKGQPVFLKDKGGFIDLGVFAELFRKKAR